MKKTSFNDFEFIRTLGKGAFSTVYLVRRKQDQRQYALKSITMEKLKENEQQNSVNEIRILASISHPNVIGYKEAFFNEKNKTLNIVMEYCDDGDLETKITNMKRNKQKFEECLIWNYALQILGGLKVLHDKKILHRDLKSANIFLTKENNQCKIGDLNVSKVMKDKYLENSQIGTPTYSSPEVWKNKPYSYKSDLWSVGCIIYEMCCLRTPFKGKNLDELCENICNGKFEKISSRYSNDLWNLIKMLLEVDVNKRADFNNILNCDFIKDKINEISDIYNDNNYLNVDDDTSMLDTIEYKNLRDLENKIPNKKKYTKIKKRNVVNENKDLNIEDTIKNDSSVDEFSISEHKPIHNINKKYSYFNDNNILFTGNNKDKNDNTNILPNIKNEIILNKSLIIHKKFQSSKFLSLEDIFFDIDLNEYELKIKFNKSTKKINNALFKSFKKKNYIKYKSRDQRRRFRKNKQIKKGIDKHNNNNLSNNIILLPGNKVIKSGLMSLKEDIARKISQNDLPISSYIKKSSDEPVHKISNSNPKYVKEKKIKSEKNSTKNVNNSVTKKSIKHSLFDPIVNDKKEKSKFQNQNQNHNQKKNNVEIIDNYNKIKSGELSKFMGHMKKINKIKKNGIIKKNKIDINDIDLVDQKKMSDKNNRNILNSNNTKELYNENIIKNKNKVGNNNKIMYNDKFNLQNNINRTEICIDEKPKKVAKISDKTLNKHIQGLFDNTNIINKNKNIKSNKCINNYKNNSKVIEIDICNNNNNNSNLKKNITETKNPFNSDQKINNINLSSSQELRTSKVYSQKLNRQKLSIKINNNIKNSSNKSVKFGDN